MKTFSRALIAAALLASPAFAGAPCPTLVDSQAYEAGGGKLVPVKRMDFANLPPFFFCDRPACSGTLDFQGVVDSEGKVGSLQVTRNTWKVDPDGHAATVQTLLAATRYEEPRLGGKPVCVKTQWSMFLAMEDRPTEP